MELKSLTGWTLLGLTVVSLVIGGLGGLLVGREVRGAYMAAQVQANEAQASRISRLLEQQMAAGASRDQVTRTLQYSLVNSVPESGSFLCLLDGKGEVLCHPDPQMLGRIVRQMTISDLGGKRVSALGQRLAQHTGGPGILARPDLGAAQVVYQKPVRGTDWMVSVHTDSSVIRERVRQLEITILKVWVPTFLGFIVFGTFAARLIGRRYERRIEDMNQSLEEAVQKQTVDIVDSAIRFRSLFESAPSAIFVRGQDGEILDVNHQAVELTGLSREELRASKFEELCQGSNQAPVARESGPLPLGEIKQWSGTLKQENGDLRNVRIYERRIQQKENWIIQDILQDVTELAVCEMQLQQSQKLEAIGQLAGGIAHDFNNLLTAILGFSELALSSLEEGAPARQHIETVIQSGERAGRLTQQLLAFSRKQVLEPQVIALNDHLREIEKMLRRIIGDDIEVSFEYDEALWPVLADPVQFEQIIFNLATNARDAMPEGGSFRITTRNLPSQSVFAGSISSENRDRVLFTVQDSGCGIPKEIEEKVFEPFFTTKEKGKGTGLGLATVHGIIKQHGGDIKIISQPGEGTKFLITLPRSKTESDSSETGERSAIRHGHESVLLVEDDQVLRNMTERTLTGWGYRVFAAPNGDKALELANFAQEKFDLLLTDVVMPGMGVKEMVDRLRTKQADLKILYITGYADETVFRNGLAAEGFPILHKPFSPRGLGKRLRQILNG